jgi:hypothetical protein
MSAFDAGDHIITLLRWENVALERNMWVMRTIETAITIVPERQLYLGRALLEQALLILQQSFEARDTSYSAPLKRTPGSY